MIHRTKIEQAGHVTRMRMRLFFGVVALGLAALAHGCEAAEVQTLQPQTLPSTGELGGPCGGGLERSPLFAGYRISEDVIHTQFAGCDSGTCLVNHFQGRVSCPLGQEAPVACAGPDDASCGAGRVCVATGAAGPYCDSSAEDGGASQCASGSCNPQSKTCACGGDGDCPQGTLCDPVSLVCSRFVCHQPGNCQIAGATEAQNQGKECCAQGVDIPVTEAVCGQCEQGSGRSADEAAYCSCRCGPDDGAAPDGSEYCACPDGFECSLIRKNVGLGDPAITGKYCIKAGTAYTDESQCGSVSGQLTSECAGDAAD